MSVTNRLRIILLVAGTLLTGSAPSLTAQSNGDAGMPWEAAKTATLKKFDGRPHSAQRVEPFKIVDNVFYVGLETVAAYLIPTSDGLILLDTTYADTADIVIDNVRKLGQDPARIKYVLITHGHADHVGGAGRIKEMTGARVGMSATEWDSIERLRGDPANQANGIRLMRDLVIKDGEMLTLGDTQLWLYVIGGPTAGNMVAEIHAVVAGRQFRTVLGVTLEPSSGTTAASLRSVERLRELGPWDAFLPSHPYLAPSAVPVTARQAFGLEAMAANPTKQAPLVGAQRVNAYLDQIRSTLQTRSR